MAVISFDLESTAIWPSVSRASLALADPQCSGLGPGDRAAEGDDDHLEQVVNACPLDARIGKIFKRCKNRNESLGHGKTLRELVLHEGIKARPLPTSSPL